MYLIIARTYGHDLIKSIEKASNVPVINALSDTYHPCQGLSDLMTIRQRFKDLSKINVAWVGDGNNVCNSLIIGCLTLNIPIFAATPKNFRPPEIIYEWIKQEKKENLIRFTEDPKEAVKDADIIYTDTFISMGQEQETENRLKIFKPFQVNKELINSTKKCPLIMHCLPAHRGIEITDDVFDSKNCIVFEQAENRLHLQKALMIQLLK